GDPGAGRRRAGRDLADFVLLAVGEALEEPAPLPRLEMDLVGALTPEGVALLERPPFPDVPREEPERVLDRALHVDRLPDRHSRSSCSANALNAASAWSQTWLTRSTEPRAAALPGDVGDRRYIISRPRALAATRPASRSTRRCFDTAGREIESPQHRSPARWGLRPMRSISMRRVGSARAAKVRSRVTLTLAAVGDM